MKETLVILLVLLGISPLIVLLRAGHDSLGKAFKRLIDWLIPSWMDVSCHAS